jgi:hypothetical protein
VIRTLDLENKAYRYDFDLSLLGQVNLINRLSSRVTKKYGAGGRILFIIFISLMIEKLLMTILFLSTKRGVI